MNLSQSYARALYDVSSKEDIQIPEMLKNLRQALMRRGHEKLLPRIFSEFEKLSLRDERLREYKTITPEAERTRVLLELYRKLTKEHTQPHE